MKWLFDTFLLLLLSNNLHLASSYGKNMGFKEETVLGFQGSDTSGPKTLIVPRSNKIQIAFADDGSDPRTKLHMDLLRLYKQVMEEVLERNKLISTVQVLLDKVSQMDELANRVHRLEQEMGIMQGSSDLDSYKHRSSGTADESKEDAIWDSDRQWNEDEYQGTTTTFAESNFGADAGTKAEITSFRARLHQQDKIIRRLQEDLRIQTKLTAEQGREIQRHNEQMERLKSTVNDLQRKSGDTTIISADDVDTYSGQINVLRANVATVESKLNKLTLDLQWHEFKLNMQQNSTDNLQKEVEGIENTVSSLYTKSGSLQTIMNQVRADSIQCKSKLHTSIKKIHGIETHIEKIASALSRPTNKTQMHSKEPGDSQAILWKDDLDSNVYSFVEEATSRMFNMVHRINSSQHHLIISDKRQQKQLDELSLDVESLKDELDDYFGKLRDLDSQAAELKDNHKGERREREKIKRKLERLQRDINVVMGALSAYGMTTEPSQVVRRTTQARTLVTRDVTVPDMTRTFVTPSTRSRSLTPDPLLKVTRSPNNRENEAKQNDLETEVDTERVTEKKVDHFETSTTPVPDRTNCSVVGFGEALMVRAFPRMLMGSWNKDIDTNSDKIYAMLNNEKVSHVREYASEEALRINNITAVHKLPFKCTGTGHLVYKGSVYCNKYQSNRIMKYNIKTGEIISERIKDAGYNNSYPYTSGSMTDFDFAVDEKGLWVIYSSTKYNGNIVISKLDDNNLRILQRFATTFPKTSASNTFMVCGRLYVTVYDKYGPVSVQYIYDTETDTVIPVDEGKMHFSGDKPEYLTMLDYNPKEHKLYGWRMSKNWDGEIITYDVYFATT